MVRNKKMGGLTNADGASLFSFSNLRFYTGLPISVAELASIISTITKSPMW